MVLAPKFIFKVKREERPNAYDHKDRKVGEFWDELKAKKTSTTDHSWSKIMSMATKDKVFGKEGLPELSDEMNLLYEFPGTEQILLSKGFNTGKHKFFSKQTKPIINCTDTQI